MPSSANHASWWTYWVLNTDWRTCGRARLHCLTHDATVRPFAILVSNQHNCFLLRVQMMANDPVFALNFREVVHAKLKEFEAAVGSDVFQVSRQCTAMGRWCSGFCSYEVRQGWGYWLSQSCTISFNSSLITRLWFDSFFHVGRTRYNQLILMKFSNSTCFSRQNSSRVAEVACLIIYIPCPVSR